MSSENISEDSMQLDKIEAKLNESNHSNKKLDDDFSPKFDRKYSTTYQLTKGIKFVYEKNINSNFDDIADNDTSRLETLKSYIPEAINTLSPGLIKKKNEAFNINFSPDFNRPPLPSLLPAAKLLFVSTIKIMIKIIFFISRLI